jgi:hypothetical protein
VTLWFVTPAWQRYEITAICLEQRKRVIAELLSHGIEARQVVIADDENLDIARALDCDIVERDNEMVGRKFNDGMEYAGKHGAEWIVPIGSDSWIATDYFLDLDSPRYTRTSEAYCSVKSDVLAELWVSPDRLAHSAGPYVFHRTLLEPAGFRPSAEGSVMVDTSTIRGIERHKRIRWRTHTVHPFQYIGFRAQPMMTSHNNLVRRWGVAKHNPWSTLRRYYPPDLVERARAAMRRNDELGSR